MPAAVKPIEFAPGAHVGKYRIDSLLSGDEFSATYLVSQESMDRPIALRSIVPQQLTPLQSPQTCIEALRHFESVIHPHFVRVLEVAEYHAANSSIVFVATEIVDGNSLSELVVLDGAIPAELVDTIIRQLGSALQAIQEQGLNHGAVTPENIVLTHDGDAKLLYPSIGSQHGVLNDLEWLGRTAYYLLSADPRAIDPSFTFDSDAFDRGSVPEVWRRVLLGCLKIADPAELHSVTHFLAQLDLALGTTTTSSDNNGHTKADPIPSPVKLYANARTTNVHPSSSLRNWLVRRYRQLFSIR